MTTETIPCPLCLGVGKLKRTEVLDRLGVKDFARVAQLSAEEAFRLLQSKHDHEHQRAWSRFETELAKRTAEIRERHKDELRSAQTQRDDLTRRVERLPEGSRSASGKKPAIRSGDGEGRPCWQVGRSQFR